MKFPPGFNTTRANLDSSCLPVSMVGLNSYESSSKLDAKSGAGLLGNAITDNTRLQRPSNWHAVLLFASANDAQTLADDLFSLNQLCPLKPLVEAQRFAVSLATLDNHKMQPATGDEQSLEWMSFNDVRNAPALADAFLDASNALIVNESKDLISDIDSALTELNGLKTARDARLTQAHFQPAMLNIDVLHFAANSAQALAENIKRQGNNKMHWAYSLFVGSAEAIQPVKELFL